MIRKVLFQDADIQELHSILCWLRDELAKKGLKQKIVHQIELAVEEALSNIIEHGFENKKEKIEVGIKWSPNRLEIIIRDWAPPFDPLGNPSVIDLNASLEKRQIGGLGIHIMKQSVDEFIYQRKENANVLTLIKRVSIK
ncbi:MAG TPA: ATP-binding protein [Chlamydiales bacterium]|nr:ATP-binding protein [Chlamydiales bacterium]